MDESLAAKIMTVLLEENGMNVRSTRYLLLQAVTSCPRCAQPTSVFCFGLLPGHERRLADQWTAENCGALLFYVERLSSEAVSLVRELAPGFRLDYSGDTNGDNWLNHCQHCGARHADYDLHCEPDGAFLPTGAPAAAQIQTVAVWEPFSALAAGFSEAPSSITSMQTAE
jgi:hypothetical protein